MLMDLAFMKKKKDDGEKTWEHAGLISLAGKSVHKF